MLWLIEGIEYDTSVKAEQKSQDKTERCLVDGPSNDVSDGVANNEFIVSWLSDSVMQSDWQRTT